MRRAGHEQDHIPDTCRATDQLKVIKCNNRPGRIVVACPHCNQGVAPGIGTSVDVTTGKTVILVCHGCSRWFDLNRQTIAKCLDETYLVPTEPPASRSPQPQG